MSRSYGRGILEHATRTNVDSLIVHDKKNPNLNDVHTMKTTTKID